jgi:hypothetical protein
VCLQSVCVCCVLCAVCVCLCLCECVCVYVSYRLEDEYRFTAMNLLFCMRRYSVKQRFNYRVIIEFN